MNASEKRQAAKDFLEKIEYEFGIEFSEMQEEFAIGYLVSLLDHVEREVNHGHDAKK